jgi:phytoene dehydrogenase-like protein
VSDSTLDAVVVGSGPNGLAAAVTLARAGRSVHVYEAADEIGGGTRTAELIEPGFHHDVCSAVHPFGVLSPFFAHEADDLERLGLRWCRPEIDLTHPLDGGRVAVLRHDLAATVAGLGEDGRAYERLVGPTVRNWPKLVDAVLGPVVRIPRHPVALARFGVVAVAPATVLGRGFSTEEGKALLAGAAAHAFLPLDHLFSGAFGLTLLAGSHLAGWPVAEGGSHAITKAMAGLLTELGGEITTGRRVGELAELPASRVVLFDIAPAQVADIAHDSLPGRFRRKLTRFRPGPGVFKIDYTLDGPVPWADPHSAAASTVHLGGTMAEIAAAEADVAAGRHAERPYVLVAQQSVMDPTRAPEGKHTLWAYCHVPNGSTLDQTAAIEGQIERFAPGFRDVVRGRAVMNSPDYEAYNPTLLGGSITGGAHDGLQLVFRPTWRNYRTPNDAIWLCSSSTPPGGGVHGMCGRNAAQRVLASVLR